MPPRSKQPKTARGLVVNAVAGFAPEILLYGDIGPWDITAQDFLVALQRLGNVDELTVRINSMGGEVFAAVAMYNALVGHPARVTTVIDGVAASAAGFVLQAGDIRQSHANGTFHAHPAQGFAYGSADEIEQYLTLLRNTDEIIQQIFAARTGLAEARLTELLGRETWLKAEQALDEGFIDEILQAPATERPTAAQHAAYALDLQFASQQYQSLQQIAAQTEGVRMVTVPAPANNATPTPTGAPPATPAASPATPAANASANPPAAEPASAPAAPVATPPAAAPAANGQAAPLNEHAEIVRLCVACSCPAQAAAWIEQNVPLDQVRAKLLDQQIAARPVSPTPPADFASASKPPEDPDAKFKAEYAAAQQVYARAGVTQEAYVASRRKDEGLA